ncbi:oligopeptide transport system ATP-binding protein [Thermosporothrix hazakensis]|jgi:oligopeptide transport system ATP-binding protein|uniref:Oligopeptide transport system ATP-binding protein n=1 Tax=Thermosporothrix hazakensis TaxID=644383 RepID=A0A326UB80_THEHA|nr:ABC transporter ATP-binding protein [Thermosporothrix hazakensis]PZW32849.1 oligopeptide transport system ATP-binding protein [Thermosporothrix hazakensis]GCE48880.1 ABC transporter ATP-binding protein [Thermosporothrix hazakensis]
MGKYLLEVQDLKTYFKVKQGYVRAVDGVSFAIAPGERVAIVGESGCGKSVTALSIMRLVAQPPGEYKGGSILFEDMDLLDQPESVICKIRGAKIGMIFQDPMTCLNPTMTVGKQIAEGLRLHLKIRPDEARKRAITLLEQVGIPAAAERYHSYPHQFSGGMRQRVMIAIALACNPKLLIADEPTTALDVTVQAQILELMNGICREFGTALMLITHDLGVVAGMTDRVVVMYAGKVVEEAPTEELFANPRHPYTLGLLESVPRLDQVRDEELRTIEGAPPDLLAPPPGCPFMPRCAFARKQCLTMPPLDPLPKNEQHRKACWFDITDPKVREYAERRRAAMEALKAKALETTGNKTVTS